MTKLPFAARSAQIRRANAPVQREIEGPDGRFLVAYDLLKDRRGVEVAMLVAQAFEVGHDHRRQLEALGYMQ